MWLFDNLITAPVGTFIADRFLGNAGEVRNLNIEASAKKIQFDLDLEGETELIHVQIDSYELSDSGNDGTQIKILDVSCSKPWMSTLLRSHKKNLIVPIPSPVAFLLA